MSEHVYLLTLCLPLAAILLVVGLRSFTAVQQAKARLASDEAFRQVAAKAIDAQTQTATALASIDASLTDLRARLGAVEKILKAVE
jgi:hypothetical protein